MTDIDKKVLEALQELIGSREQATTSPRELQSRKQCLGLTTVEIAGSLKRLEKTDVIRSVPALRSRTYWLKK